MHPLLQTLDGDGLIEAIRITDFDQNIIRAIFDHFGNIVCIGREHALMLSSVAGLDTKAGCLTLDEDVVTATIPADIFVGRHIQIPTLFLPTGIFFGLPQRHWLSIVS